MFLSYTLGSWVKGWREKGKLLKRDPWEPGSIRIGFFAAIFCGGGIQGDRLAGKYLGRKKWIGGSWNYCDSLGEGGWLLDINTPISGKVRIGKFDIRTFQGSHGT